MARWNLEHMLAGVVAFVLLPYFVLTIRLHYMPIEPHESFAQSPSHWAMKGWKR